MDFQEFVSADDTWSTQITELDLTPGPFLRLAVSDTNVFISWPTEFTGFALFESDDLTSTNWSAVTNTPTTTNGQFQVVVQRLSVGKRFYRAMYQVTNPISIPATSGTITSPFVITNGYIYQPVETVGLNGGRAAYNFTINNAGNYVIQVLLNAPDGGANSIFLNIDAEPQSPYMIWDILPFTSGFEQRTLNWRGNGTFGTNEFVPKVFTLTSGSHQLIIRGREANTLLQTITILPYP